MRSATGVVPGLLLLCPVAEWGCRGHVDAPLAPAVQQLALFLAQALELRDLVLEDPLQAQIADVQLHLVHAVLEEHHHAHGGGTALNEAHQALVVHTLHVVPVDRQDHVPWTHPSTEGRPIILDIVHVRDEFYFSISLVVDAIRLQCKSKGALASFHDDGSPASVLVRAGNYHPVIFHPLQDLMLRRFQAGEDTVVPVVMVSSVVVTLAMFFAHFRR